ncbi:hypothetical protein ABTZ46_19895 [Nocardioides sp. NPDC126508]
MSNQDGVAGLRGGGWIGPTGLVLAAGMLGIVALPRLIVGIPKVTQSYYNSLYRFEDRPVVWVILGLLLIASIVPIAVAVVLGHVGVSRAKAAGTSAAASGIALGIGYTLVVFWGVRIINAIVNAAQFHGGFRMFIEYVGLWA